MHIQLLGGFCVSIDGQVVDDAALRLRKARSLIKLLALAPRHILPSEQLMELLWPDVDPTTVANRFHQTLLEARRALATTGTRAHATMLLHLRRQVLSLQPPGGLVVDVDEFDDATATARRTADPAAYEAAIARYTGDLLPDDCYEEWAADRREALRQTYLSLLLELASLYAARQQTVQAISVLRKIVAFDAAHEEAHAGLMRLFALTGRRQQALRQFHQLREALWRELEVAPDAASQHLYQEILTGQFPPATAAAAPPSDGHPHNLPTPLTSFIGREAERTASSAVLAGEGSGTRLVTLTGVGGCGKSRLALAVATELIAAFPNGVWLVELGALAEPTLVPEVVATTLGVREEPGQPLPATLAAALRAKHLLLVLDNCEHLIDACAQLAQTLLGTCPNIRSRTATSSRCRPAV
jgi:DNA-binding SARP family transcriptional activator